MFDRDGRIVIDDLERCERVLVKNNISYHVSGVCRARFCRFEEVPEYVMMDVLLGAEYIIAHVVVHKHACGHLDTVNDLMVFAIGVVKMIATTSDVTNLEHTWIKGYDGFDWSKLRAKVKPAKAHWKNDNFADIAWLTDEEKMKILSLNPRRPHHMTDMLFDPPTPKTVKIICERAKAKFVCFLMGTHERGSSPVILLCEDVLEIILKFVLLKKI